MNALLRFWRSRQILVLLGMLTTTMLLSVCMVTFSTIPLISKFSSFSLTLYLRAIGTQLGECCVGFTRESVIMAVSPMCPGPSKTSL